ncbi:glycosyltransferase family 22 protein [Lasiosphaeria hispida]|uniref:Mannosyltransferase n=1 Tax=Lasiosphaeria hispida TaxID=260671 RepID=A0AAJ0HMB8_9PEZI|nr:glycosyltransferase family 22 protein [Lasiosphaeria hispida]
MDTKPAAVPARQEASKPEVPKTPKAHKLHPEVVAAQAKDILSVLLVLRFVNAISVRTFFQPDEYYQALEPAWSIAFGTDSGAWLTWEWQHQLRSSLHPVIFGLAYKSSYALMTWLEFFAPFKSLILVALPSVIQCVFAALGDFYTWKLATEIFGAQSNLPFAALWMTILNPWQWYCSTRTFSNSLETTLTIAALYYWPWELLADSKNSKDAPLQSKSSVNSLRVSLFLAAIAVLLRPTNLLIWLGILTLVVTRLTLDGTSHLQVASIITLLREIIICGTATLAISILSDRLYFGFWAFPPYQWLYFNITQSLAVFYGQMPWHYYLSQGIPLLTTTFLPFTLIGLYKSTLSLSPSPSATSLTTLQSNILRTLSFAVLTMLAALSLISHKEVRFIYPLLPILHILGAPYILTFFTTPSPSSGTTTTTTITTTTTTTITLRHKLFLANILSVNLLLAGYLTLAHQPAPLSVLTFLRTDFERLHPQTLSLTPPNPPQKTELFALFLTPCHSTPWRSHLVYSALRARALTCEPPLATAPNSVERETYLDEADRFYQREDDGGYGAQFLREEMWPLRDGERGGEVPRYIVGFEGVEEVLRGFFEGEGADLGVELSRVWEAWNGAFNEDARRRGKLVVWDTGVWELPEGTKEA